MANRMDATELEKCIEDATNLAHHYRHEYLTPEHILYSALDNSSVREMIEDIGSDPSAIQSDVQKWLEDDNIPVTGHGPRKVSTIDDLVQATVARAMFGNRSKIDVRDVILSLVDENNADNDSFARYFLRKHNITPLAIKEVMSHGGDEEDEEGGAAAGGMAGAMGQGDPLVQNPEKMTKKRAQKVLEKFCINLNEKANEGGIDPLIGRETEVENTVHTLSRRRKNNVIYVGEPGVGKTAIAEGLAKRIVEESVPEIISESTVWSLDVGNLVAGTRYRGDFEERMKAVLKALTITDTDPILFIDEIHLILGSGAAGGSSMDVANLLKPALARGELRCIGSTTLEEYRNQFEKDRALARRFQRQDIEEPSIEDSKRILKGLKSYYEEYHGVSYEDAALDCAVELTDRYVTNRYLPDKAIDVMDAAGARQRIMPEQFRKATITHTEVEREVANIARMPEKNVGEDEKAKLGDLESDLKNNVYGQNTALDALRDAVFVSRAGLREGHMPSGKYLFTGPTGVGKTEAAKQLAHTMGMHFVRFDMSEYMEEHSVSKLIGAPPGYVGHDESNGLLVDAIDSHPYCVLLLDEIEKAHPKIFNILLQVMDHGKLTNSKGKMVDFKNVFIILTSNVGAREAEKPNMGFKVTEDDTQQDYSEAIEQLFSPEFRNRLDAVITFNKLNMENIVKVVDKFIKELNQLAAESNVKVKVTKDAKRWLAENGYDPAMGARPMARVIHKHIKTPLSREMLTGSLASGGTAKFDLDGDGLKLEVETKKQEEPAAQ
jgi:ATP-dependent Clp protease ATP-binding subunit ClpA